MPNDPKPLLHFQRRVRWKNKHLNVERQVERRYDVWNRWSDGSRPEQQVWRAGLMALQQIVRDAAAQNRRVRAVGGAWSLSEAAATSDFLINTRPLNFIDVGLSQQSCAATFTGKPEHLVFAQCGTSILELNQALEARGLALPTSGASNGQSIAGAIATGTHGSANGVGSMQDFVVGLHVIGEDGRHYWLERGSRPVVSPSFVARLGAEARREDELFEAALVSFGSFGLVHAVLLEVVPLYVLERHVRSYDFPAVTQALATLDVSGLGLPRGPELPYHFEVVVNPYELGAGERGAHVRVLYKVAEPAPGARLPALTSTGLGDDLLGVVGAVTDAVPEAIPAAVELVLGEQIQPVSGALGTPGQTFNSTSIRGPVLSMELGVAPADVPAVLRCVADIARAFPFSGLCAVRYVKASGALLAFTGEGFGPIAATIEIPCAGSQRSLEAFDRIWEALDQRNIRHSFHWGQCMPPDYGPAHIARVYGDRAERWVAARRRFLPTPAGRRRFANGFIERLGLAD